MNNDFVCEYKLRDGRTLRTYIDEDLGSPRDPDQNEVFGKLILFMRGNSSGLGDKHEYEDIEAFLEANPEKDGICKKVFGYIHSGTVLRIAEENPFHDPWDSGFAGFFYVSKAEMRKTYGRKNVTARIVKRTESEMKYCIDTYNQWLAGENYGFRVFDASGEEIDSCWGFYGSDPEENAIFENANVEAKDVLTTTAA